MIESTTQIRVRYSETDKMGYVYYGNYPQYLEIGRTELIRKLGFSYARLENDFGILLPVLEVKMNYHAPARYDDLLTVHSKLLEVPGVKITIHSEIYNEQDKKIFTGYVTLVFCRALDMKPVMAPDFFLEAVRKNWN